MMGSLYEQDFIAWTEQQASVLRAAARGGNLPLDWEHLAEEVEDLGRSELRGLASQVRRVILHLLKLQHSPAAAPRPGWIDSVDEARADIRVRLRQDPGLKGRLPEVIRDEWPDAVRRAARALQAYGEDASGITARLTGGSYSEEQILGDWFLDGGA